MLKLFRYLKNYKKESIIGPLIVSIDAEGRNLFEENKVVFNERKEAAKQAIYPEVKFIK